MTYFIIGLITSAVILLLIRKLRINKLLDKERELTVKLKEQERITAESEASYEEAKNKFRDIVNKSSSSGDSK